MKNTLRYSEIKEKLGAKYSFIESLKMKGVGSPRIISLNSNYESIEKLTIIDNRLFSNFELYEKGILIILKEETIAIEKRNILKIEFIERPIRVITKSGVKIVRDAKVKLIISDNKTYDFYCTRQCFKSLKKFFEKKWFETLVEFKINEEIKVDNNYIVTDILGSLISGF